MFSSVLIEFRLATVVYSINEELRDTELIIYELKIK